MPKTMMFLSVGKSEELEMTPIITINPRICFGNCMERQVHKIFKRTYSACPDNKNPSLPFPFWRSMENT